MIISKFLRAQEGGSGSQSGSLVTKVAWIGKKHPITPKNITTNVKCALGQFFLGLNLNRSNFFRPPEMTDNFRILNSNLTNDTFNNC